MIQISSKPLLAIVPKAPSSGPDEEIGRHSCPEGMLVSGPPDDTSDGVFVSPPPLPFPRVFPGL